jgi:uncharacterized small protein (DUF1192 family)
MANRSSQYDRVEETASFLGGTYKFIKLKSGRRMTFWDAMDEAEKADTALTTAISRCFKLADGDYDLERIEWKIDKLESYIGALRKYLEELQGVKEVEERIALLRNVTGREPEEAKRFLAKADELEAKLSASKRETRKG